MNLQDTYGGEGSNYTKKHILQESPLVFMFQDSHQNFEKNFMLMGLSHAHATKDMSSIYQKLMEYTIIEKPNEFIRNRRTTYSIPDKVNDGAAIIIAEGESNDVHMEDAENAEEGRKADEKAGEISAEDLSMEGAI